MPMNLQFFAAKGDESGSKSGSNTVYSYDGVKQVSEYLQSHLKNFSDIINIIVCK